MGLGLRAEDLGLRIFQGIEFRAVLVAVSEIGMDPVKVFSKDNSEKLPVSFQVCLRYGAVQLYQDQRKFCLCFSLTEFGLFRSCARGNVEFLGHSRFGALYCNCRGLCSKSPQEICRDTMASKVSAKHPTGAHLRFPIPWHCISFSRI